MTRRAESLGDSLDLLLDTICNLFGGIVFISLLVVVMLQMSRKPEMTSETPIDGADIELMEGELEKMHLQQSRLSQLRQGQLELVARLIPRDFQNRLDAWKALDADRNQLEIKVLQFEQSNLERVKDVDESQRDLAATAQRVKDARKLLQSLEKECESASSQQSQTLPLAELREDLIGVQVALCYDRLYLRHQYSQGEAVGPNLEDYIVSEVDDEEIHIQPLITKGVVVDGSSRSRELILRKLRDFSPARHQIDVTVWPDSYDSFRFLRSVLADRQFRYAILACDAETRVRDRGGKHQLSQ